jgi:hypothetical protein
MTARKHDTTVIDFNRGSARLIQGWKQRALNQRAATGGAPVALGIFSENCAALAADSLHAAKDTLKCRITPPV